MGVPACALSASAAGLTRMNRVGRKGRRRRKGNTRPDRRVVCRGWQRGVRTPPGGCLRGVARPGGARTGRQGTPQRVQERDPSPRKPAAACREAMQHLQLSCRARGPDYPTHPSHGCSQASLLHTRHVGQDQPLLGMRLELLLAQHGVLRGDDEGGRAAWGWEGGGAGVEGPMEGLSDGWWVDPRHVHAIC